MELFLRKGSSLGDVDEKTVCPELLAAILTHEGRLPENESSTEKISWETEGWGVPVRLFETTSSYDSE